MLTDDEVMIRVVLPTFGRTAVEDFRSEALAAIEAVDGKVCVDLSGVNFIDSSGVGALLHLSNSLPEERRPLRLTGVAPEVLGVLELVRVHRVFEIEATA